MSNEHNPQVMAVETTNSRETAVVRIRHVTHSTPTTIPTTQWRAVSLRKLTTCYAELYQVLLYMWVVLAQHTNSLPGMQPQSNQPT